jgi:integrase
LTPPPPINREQVEVLTSLLDSKGLDAGDLLDAIKMLADAKAKAGKVPSPDEQGMKLVGDKEFLYAGFTDAWIYRNNKTQGRNYYLRVKEKGKTPFIKSLDTPDRSEALVRGRLLYQEVKGKINRGEKSRSLITVKLIEKYLKSEAKKISPVPKAGITTETYAVKKGYLKIWQKFIDEKKLSARPIEQIPREIGKEFPYWVQSQEKQAYKSKPYSHAYINSAVVEVKSMYHKYALENRYISLENIPTFERLRVQPDSNHKRDLLTEEEWLHLTTYMRTNAYLKPEGRTNLERCKRQIFREYMLIAYNTGARPNELLKMTWGDVRINPQDTPEHQEVMRLLQVKAENSKTGRSRWINAPVARRLQRLQRAYEDIGKTCEPADYLFRNPTWERQTLNIPWGQPALTKRLANVLEWSGIQKELDKTNRKIVLYSQRHFYVTLRLRNGMNIHLLAKNIGSSVLYIEKNYSHIQIESNTDKITQGMAKVKSLEETD